MALTIYYDGQCPFCARYVRLMRLREAVGAVDLVDVREHAAAKAALTDAGFNLDEGMVVDFDGRRYGGADAAHLLATLSSPSTFLNSLNKALLGRKWSAAALYPILRSGRWLALFLLGRDAIAGDAAGASARAAIFGSFFALFSIFHIFNYAFEYARFPPGLDQIAIAITAAALFFRPASPRLLFLLALASTVSAWVQAPVGSNHTMVRNFALIGYWLAFMVAMTRGRSRHDIFAFFAPSGQAVLLGMYFFGIFHKINTDFLNPATSCAVALWREMPAPLSFINHPVMDYTAIYGTFIVEGVIIAMLLTRRLRHIGIVAGIGFHSLLALSGYALYITFTTLAISLHTLFLSRDSASRVMGSALMQTIKSRLRNPVYLAAAGVAFILLASVAAAREYTLATLMVLPIIIPFCWAVIRYGAESRNAARVGTPRIGQGIAAIVALGFFANGFLPYAGLKSAQSINMFANLRLEDGVSNHLLFPNGPGPFGYLDTVVTVKSVDNAPDLEYLEGWRFSMVNYAFLNLAQNHPHATFTIERNGSVVSDISYADLQSEAESTLHPEWVRKWFHFQPVALEQPEQCNV